MINGRILAALLVQIPLCDLHCGDEGASFLWTQRAYFSDGDLRICFKGQEVLARLSDLLQKRVDEIEGLPSCYYHFLNTFL